MELMTEEKKGLKRTDVGLIPEDWEIHQLIEVGEVIMGQSPPGSSYNQIKKGVPLINGPTEFTHLFPKKIQWTTKPTKFCKHDDILICVRGSSTGRINISNDEYCIGRGIAAIRAKQKNYNKFLEYQVRNAVTEIVSKTSGSTFPNVDGKTLKGIKIPVPPTLQEQQAIASALSDVDELIRSLDGLIQKKQAIKKGTMQQLLTGKKRLPGFDGEWEVKRLGEIGNTFNGLSGKTKADFGDGNHPYITFMNVMSNTVIDTSIFDTVKVRRGESQSEIKKGDLLFNTSSETPEEVGMCSVLSENVENLHLNSFCFGYRIHEQDDVLPLFIAYYFRSEFGRKHMQTLAQGSTRYNLSKSKFVKIEIELPVFEEQKAIAQILSDMDRELQILRKKREKYVQIKQGMMQELLTGKVRLV